MKHHSDALNRLFTFGYIAKGIVYLLVGGLTLATVLGFSVGSGGVDGPRAVIKWLEEQPLGSLLVGLLGVGLVGYGIWRLYRGFADPTDEGHDAKGTLKRVGYVGSGLANGVLGVFALRAALTSGSSNSGGTDQQGMVASLLQDDLGVWLVGIVGAGVIAAGVYQLVKAAKASFMDSVHWHGLSRDTIKALGRWGFAARGVVFGIIGYFLILAAVRTNASAFKGTSGALEWLGSHGYGIVLLALVSAGMLLYGAFSIVKGRYGSIADA